MANEEKDRSEETPQPTQNPEADPAGATGGNPHRSHKTVSGDEAAAAGERATVGEAVDRKEIVEGSAYQDNSADVGQQAADAERAARETSGEDET